MKRKLSIFTLLILILVTLPFLARGVNKDNINYKSLNKSLKNQFVPNKIVEECRDRLYLAINEKCFDNIVVNYEKNDPNLILPLIVYLAEDSKLNLKCHDLTHRAGAIISSSITVKDILLLDFNYCNYGLQHGALDALTKVEKLDSDYIQLLCNSLAKGDYLIGNCNHTLGHIIVEHIEANPNSAVKLCEKDKTGACINGVLMSFLQGYGNPINYEHYFTDKDKISTVLSTLCSKMPTKHIGRCTILFPAYAYKYFPEDLDMVNYLCEPLSEFEKRSCYRGIAQGVSILGIDNSEIEKDTIVKKCRQLDNYSDQCFIGYALYLLNNHNKPNFEVCNGLLGLELKYCNVGLEMFKGGVINERYSLS